MGSPVKQGLKWGEISHPSPNRTVTKHQERRRSDDRSFEWQFSNTSAAQDTQASSASSIMSTPAIGASISPHRLQTNKMPLAPISAQMAVTAAVSRTKAAPTRSLSIFPLSSVPTEPEFPPRTAEVGSCFLFY